MESLLFHPKVVHIPLALGVLMPPLALAIAFAWWRRWLPARAWLIAVAMQAVLVGSTYLALESGEREEERVEAVVPTDALHAHEEAAEVFFWSTIAVLVVMSSVAVASRFRLAPVAGMVVAMGSGAALVLAVQTGEAGGRLVYAHGAANAYTAAPTGAAGEGAAGEATPAAPPGRAAEQDDD